MKKVIIISLFLGGMTIVSCSKDSCKDCTDCKTLATATLCEDDFESTSDYNDQVANYESDGCNCENN